MALFKRQTTPANPVVRKEPSLEDRVADLQASHQSALGWAQTAQARLSLNAEAAHGISEDIEAELDRLVGLRDVADNTRVKSEDVAAQVAKAVGGVDN